MNYYTPTISGIIQNAIHSLMENARIYSSKEESIVNQWIDASVSEIRDQIHEDLCGVDVENTRTDVTAMITGILLWIYEQRNRSDEWSKFPGPVQTDILHFLGWRVSSLEKELENERNVEIALASRPDWSDDFPSNDL